MPPYLLIGQKAHTGRYRQGKGKIRKLALQTSQYAGDRETAFKGTPERKCKEDKKGRRKNVGRFRPGKVIVFLRRVKRSPG